ncbi:alpha/beta hydrolase [Sphingomonas sp. PvP056]|uniref:alpha/beta hydrolase n=1 Tax=Sphingomonas sp. PvP056 TaxID=3156392 RepID=UPI003399E939
MPIELYRSDTLLVRQVAIEGCDRWVITFDHHSIGDGFDRKGFGESFLQANGISAIHVLGRGNDWYQYDDIFAAAAVVRAATSGAVRRVAYGSSMGGYAAVRLADAIGADAVLALSPQWSIDPAIASWDNRWSQDAHRIRWLSTMAVPLRPAPSSVLVYDPHLPLDRRHALLIAEQTGSHLLPVAHCLHPASTFLGEVSLLRGLLEDLLYDRFDARAMATEIRARRATSSVYLGALAERQPAVRPRTAIALARRARLVKPDSALGMLSLARILTRTGHHDEALETHRQIAIKVNRLPIYLVPFANALVDAGEGEEAIAVAGEVVDAEPDVGHLRNWFATMLWQRGERAAAVAHMARAVALNPMERRYRRKLFRYRLARHAWTILDVMTLQGIRERAADRKRKAALAAS